MIKILPALTITCVLACMSPQRASAIGITLDQIQFSSVINGVISTQLVAPPLSDFSIHAFALPDKPSADASWQFVNTANVATFGGDFSLSDIGDASGLSQTSVQSFLYFTLSESVNYSVTGGLQLLNPAVSPPYSAGSLGFNIGIAPTPGFMYGSGVTTNLPGEWQTPQLTGTFGPGSYYFTSQAVAFFGGEVNGGFSLRLTALEDHHVPDAGSTLSLLGIALGALRFCRR